MTDSLQLRYDSLRAALVRLEGDLQQAQREMRSQTADLRERSAQLQGSLDSLSGRLSALTDQHQDSLHRLGLRMSNLTVSTRSQHTELAQRFDRGEWAMVGSAVGVLLLIAALAVMLSRRMRSSGLQLSDRLSKMRHELEQEAVQLDEKLVALLERQLSAQPAPPPEAKEVDHSLALKVADELVRIQSNLSRMDPKMQGIKQLASSVRRIQTNLTAKGYEVVEMLGLDYDENMRVQASFITSEELPRDKQVITRIIKPQVNYQGVMVQVAQIEVTVGE